MRLLEITPGEQAAKKHGRRKYDQVSVHVWASAVIGAGLAAMYMFEKVETPGLSATAGAMLLAAVCGACVFGTLARAPRTGDPTLLMYTVAAGVVFAIVAVAFDQQAGSVLAEPAVTTVSGTVRAAEEQPVSEATVSTDESPASTVAEVASAGPVPPGAGDVAGSPTTIGAVPTVDTPTSCTMDLHDGTEPPDPG